MTPWRFYDFVRGTGENPFEAWLSAQDAAVRAAIATTIYYRRVIDDWQNPLQKSAKNQFEEFAGKEKGLSELKCKTDDGRKFRAVGIFRPTEREFILLNGCREMFNGAYYLPLNAMKLAMEYKIEFEAAPDFRRVERFS